jgi:transposase-like protein
VISDDHPRLRQAIPEVLPEAKWQRCYVHFLRKCLDRLPRKKDDDSAVSCPQLGLNYFQLTRIDAPEKILRRLEVCSPNPGPSASPAPCVRKQIRW